MLSYLATFWGGMASVKFNVNHDELRQLRNERRLSQNDVAKKLCLSKNAYAKLENGETKITLERIVKLAEIFEINIMELIEKLLSGVSNSNFVMMGDNNGNVIYNSDSLLAAENKRLHDLLQSKENELKSKESENQALKDLVALLKAQIAGNQM